MYRNWQKQKRNLKKEAETNRGLSRTMGHIKFSNKIFLNENIKKTLICGAHEAVLCEPKLGHINTPKMKKSKETDRNGQKQTKNFKKRLGNGQFSVLNILFQKH